MLLATYNLHMGGRPEQWEQLLAATRADLLFVQEARDRFAATDPGLPHEIHWEAAPRRRWGSGLVVRGGALAPIPVPGFAGWVVGGRVRFAELDFHAFSVHLPSAPGKGYVAQGRRLLRALGRMRLEGPLVLGGDFNLAVGRRPAGDPIRISPGERSWLEAFEKRLGLISAWQSCHPAEPLAQTLRWRRNPSAAYHCDGFFLPLAWRERLVRALVHAGEPWIRLSDHNPVEVEIGLEGTRPRDRPRAR